MLREKRYILNRNDSNSTLRIEKQGKDYLISMDDVMVAAIGGDMLWRLLDGISFALPNKSTLELVNSQPDKLDSLAVLLDGNLLDESGSASVIARDSIFIGESGKEKWRVLASIMFNPVVTSEQIEAALSTAEGQEFAGTLDSETSVIEAGKAHKENRISLISEIISEFFFSIGILLILGIGGLILISTGNFLGLCCTGVGVVLVPIALKDFLRDLRKIITAAIQETPISAVKTFYSNILTFAEYDMGRKGPDGRIRVPAYAYQVIAPTSRGARSFC